MADALDSIAVFDRLYGEPHSVDIEVTTIPEATKQKLPYPLTSILPGRMIGYALYFDKHIGIDQAGYQR